MTITLAEQIAIEEVANGEYVSKVLPCRLGNTRPIAFGGSTVAVAIQAAYATVPPKYHLYSCLGSFLGPASTEKRILCRVTKLRDTGSFATRQVEVLQTMDDGKQRRCLHLIIDFHKDEPGVLSFDLPKPTMYSDPSHCEPSSKHLPDLLGRGIITPTELQQCQAIFGAMDSYFDFRACPEGVSTQNLQGIAKNVKTTQDHLSIPEKSSADWFRTWQVLEKPSDQAAALAFLMDTGLSFLPLSHDHKSMVDYGACSTLEFALRFFRSSIDLGDWHIRERKASVATSTGLTYSEGKVWNEAGDLVAIMSQQCILRPQIPAAAKL